MDEAVERPVSGVLVNNGGLDAYLQVKTARTDGQNPEEGDDVVDDAVVVEHVWGQREIFRAPMVTVVGIPTRGNLDYHDVYAIYEGGVLYHKLMEDSDIHLMVRTRDEDKLPTFVSEGKPFTMPNGEPFSSDQLDPDKKSGDAK